MDVRDFELLITLKETGNITRAAEKLYITQSSLSKKIQAIEKELDICLLLRSRQGIHFTPEGEIVVKRASEAACILDVMRNELNTQKGYICGTLNAGVSINYALYKLPDILATYRQKYPHVTTHISSDQSRNLYLQVTKGLIDLAVIRGEYDWKGEKILLSRERVCAIRSKKDETRSLHTLPYIGRKTDLQFEREQVQWMREQNIQPKNDGISVDNITTCVKMVQRGLGWSIVPEICLNDFDGIIEPLFFENGEPFVRSTYLMYNSNVAEFPQVKAFIDILKKYN